jgi:hypothetical protein
MLFMWASRVEGWVGLRAFWEERPRSQSPVEDSERRSRFWRVGTVRGAAFELLGLDMIARWAIESESDDGKE